MNRIKVMVVDDSAVVRQVMTSLLNADPSIEVIGVAPDPILALEKMKHQWPDVIVLDVEMPKMDGITFLKKLMHEHPTPVVICSTLTGNSTHTAMEAMANGAVSIITKPQMGLKQFLHDSGHDLIQAVKAAAHANTKRLVSQKPLNTISAPAIKNTADVILAPTTRYRFSMTQTTECIVAIGTSTGGTQALEEVLTKLPRVSPGIVIVQHMPEKFTAAFAQRLNKLCEIEVKEAQQGDPVTQGRALIAPGGRHMILKRSGAQYFVEVMDGPLVNRHKPSVDVLFRSVAQYAGANALGIIMTGMGDDGARGLKEMLDAGAATFAQDEATSIVYGMPKEAIKLGATNRNVALQDIANEIMWYMTNKK